jgi:cytochrome P450
MTENPLTVIETFRLLNRNPVEFYRRMGLQDEVVVRQVVFNRFAALTHPDHIRHILLDNAANYEKSPIARALLEPVLGRGLLTSEGEFWRRQRRSAAPAFHHKRILEFAKIMVAAAEDMLARWAGVAAAGRALDLPMEMSRVTMRIITESMFSTGLGEAQTREVGAAIRALNVDRLQLRDLIGVPEWIPRLPRRKIRANVAVIDRIVRGIVTDRRTERADRDDLLGMFMSARDDETGEGMTDRQLRDEVMTMFVAGHETTATALTWTFHALDRYREIENRLHAELDAAFPDGAPLVPGATSKVPYARRVIEETMRLFPVVPQIARQAIRDDSVGGVPIPAGTVLNVLIWLVHRHPEFWDRPEEFDPERFDAARTHERHKFAYIPFGGGGRVCIGNAFAMMEAQIILAMVARKYRLRVADGRDARPIGNVVLRPEGGLKVILEPRESGRRAAKVA